MADEVKVFSVEIDGVQREINNLKDLKKAQKDLKDSFIAGNEESAQSLAKLNVKLDELKNSTKAAKGVGLENAANSVNLLKESVANLDFDKFKTALGGIKTALASTGILLLVQGVIYLTENFDELSKGSGILAKFLQAIGDIISDIKDAFTDLIGVTSDATRALDEMGEALTKNQKVLGDAINAQSAAFDRQISVAKSAGKSTVDLEIQKQEEIVKTSTYLNLQANDFLKAGGKLSDAQIAIYEKNRQAILNANAQIDVIVNNDYKQKEDDYKKHLDELKNIKDKSDADFTKLADELLTEGKAQDQIDDADIDARQKQRDADRLAGMKLIADEQKNFTQQAVKEAQDAAEKDKALNKQAADAKKQLYTESFSALQNLSDAFFETEISNAHGNQAELNEIAKRQFNVNKALQLANAAITGTQAVLSAYASGVATPIVGPATGAIFAAAAAIVAAANIAKISATQFNPSASSSSGDAGGGAGSIPSTTPPPLPQTVSQGANSTQITQPGQVQQHQTRVILVEADVRKATDKVTKIVQQSKF